MTGRTPSRNSSYSQDTNAGPRDSAALLGAVTAFGRAVAKTGSQPTTSVRTNGAGAGASSAGPRSEIVSAGRTNTPQSSLSRSPGGRVKNDGMGQRRPIGPPDNAHLAAPQHVRLSRAASPSHEAAPAMAERAAGPDSNPPTRARAQTGQGPAVTPKSRRLSQNIGKHEAPTDTSSIAPTNSLVNLFEEKSKPGPITAKLSNDLPLRSPKPLKPTEGITAMFQMELEHGDRGSVPKASRATEAQEFERVNQLDVESSADSFASASEDFNHGSSPLGLSKENSRTLTASPASTLKVYNGAARRHAPSPSPQRPYSQPMQIKPVVRSSSMQSDTYSTSAQSTKSIAAQYHQTYPRKMTPLTTGDELANALVASTLASSRAPSPRKLGPPPVPTQRRRKHFPFSRTPSPTKAGGMLQTLRAPEASESSSDYERHPYEKHRRKRLVRKHPNKHHEGDRKRWRDAVSERERKRYEGVWAANKGLHCSFTAEEQRFFVRSPGHARTTQTKAAAPDQVSNIVARDIWLRSRLPDDVLGVVWDLVDTESCGRLRKEEFVVGMWLIDQRLKGRKLPVKVSETMWASVRSLQGIKIRK